MSVLFEKLSSLRKRVRRLLWLYGLSWVFVLVLSTAVGFGLLDRWLHFDLISVRIVCSASTAAVLLYATWRYLIAPLRVELTDIELALRIEERFGDFNDSLASTVQFLTADDAGDFGSPALQERAISRALTRIAAVDVHDVVHIGAVGRVAGMAATVILTTIVIVGLNPTEASTAVQRLVNPVTPPDWPKRTRLRILDEERREFRPDSNSVTITRGNSLKLVVLNDRGDLPEDAMIEYRFRDGRRDSDVIRRVPSTRGARHKEGQIRIEATTATVRFRIVGGDDESRWYRLNSVAPPALTHLAVTITPPAYATDDRSSGQPTSSTGGHVQALVGSRVEIVGRSNKELASATLHVTNNAPQKLKLHSSRREVRTSFLVDVEGTQAYWFQLVDADGFESLARQYDIHGLPDGLPQVDLISPSDDGTVTANAELALHAKALDDLGLVSLDFLYRAGGEDGAESVISSATTVRPLPEMEREHTWPLSTLGLVPGDQIQVYAAARDAFDLTDEPRVGLSRVTTLTVVSAEDKLRELQDRQTELLREVERLAKRQRAARRQVRELLVQQETAGGFQDADLDMLQRVEVEQSQIGLRLFQPGGLESQTIDIASQLRTNHLDDSPLENRLRSIRSEFLVLREQVLEPVQRSLTDARKHFEVAGAAATADSASWLQRAESGQTTIINTLSELLLDLASWRDRRTLVSELKEIAAEQTEIKQDAIRTGQQTLAKAWRDLTPQERANLARLADRQQQHGQRLEHFQSQLMQTADRLASSSARTTATFVAAADHLRIQGTSGRMRRAGDHLQHNRVDQAAEDQRVVLLDLQHVEGMLADKQAPAASVVEELLSLENELLQIETDLGELHSDVQRELQPGQVERQTVLIDRNSRIARHVRRLIGPTPASRAVDEVTAAMQHALQSLHSQQQTAAADHQLQALQEVGNARGALSEARARAAAQLARERLQQLASAVVGLIKRQEVVREEALKLEAQRASRGNWNRELLKELRNLADVQTGLQEETREMNASLDANDAFAFAFAESAAAMERVAKRLRMRRIDEQTQSDLDDAIAHLKLVLNTLLPSDGSHTADNENGSSESDGGDSFGAEVAQLKLLRAMQHQVNERTTTLLENPEDSERAAIGGRQRRVLELTQALEQRLFPPDDPSGEQTNTPQDASVEQSREHLRKAIVGMDDSHRALDSGTLDDSVRMLQQDIIVNLDKVLAHSRSTQAATETAPADDDRPPADANEGDGPGGQGDGSASGASGLADNSEDRADRGRFTEVPVGTTEKLSRGAWGHFPPHVREQMLNVLQEDFLPNYEDLVRNYYRALAEKGSRAEAGD